MVCEKGMEGLQSQSNVQVAVRVRPPSDHIKNNNNDEDDDDDDATLVSSKIRPRFGRNTRHGQDRAWTCTSSTIEQTGTRRVDGKSLFSFDHIFEEESPTESVYDEMVRPIVWGITNGKHGTVFCYGQTGSGKTFTMQGNDLAVRQEDGILQLAVKDIFSWIGESNRDSLVRISYFEIYNEQVRDLFSGVVEEDKVNQEQKSFQGQTVTVRLDPKLGVQVGCRELEVNNVETLLDLLEFGNRYRHVAATGMNNRSSRSHAIFRITVETRSSNSTARIATLNLVDLAGSENSRTSNTTDVRKGEGGTINKSLLSLSKVMNSLSMPIDKRPKFIGFRDSKLTYILQPHLSGNALMCIICTVSPAFVFVEETRSTLRFASRAKLVETKAKVNEVAQQESVLLQKINIELESTRKNLMEMEQRSIQSEQALICTKNELKKIKHLMFGDQDFEYDSLKGVAPQVATIKGTDRSSPTIDETRFSVETTLDKYASDQNTMQLSALSIPRLTKRRDPADVARTPPSEVLILMGASQDVDHSISDLFVTDMEQKAKFLEHRLEFAEDVIENLKSDMTNARNALHQVVHRNVRLACKVERYRAKLEKLQDEESGKLRAQYILLKWCMYLSLFFFFFHLQGLFVVSVMFVWLCLETYTASF